MSLILKSKIDKSINIINNNYESRFVQRSDNYFIVYVSGHNGCSQFCRMCHLTHTRQTSMADADIENMANQIKGTIEAALDNQSINVGALKKVHINFMARGDALLNQYVASRWNELEQRLSSIVHSALQRTDIPVLYLVSTIFPSSLNTEQTMNILKQFVAADNPPRLYWSAYPMITDKERARWLPMATNINKSLDFFDAYGYMLEVAGKPRKNKIHFALIEHQNIDIAHQVFSQKLRQDGGEPKHINLVLYNPPFAGHSNEASEQDYRKVSGIYRDAGHTVKIIPRVGTDVKASCGTFVNTLETQ